MSTWHFWLFAVLIVGPVVASDVPFVFDAKASGLSNYTSTQLEQAHISSPDLLGVPTVIQPADSETLDFPVTGGGSTPEGTTEKKMSELKKMLNSRVEPDNQRVRKEARRLALKYPGDHTIDQICSIYGYLKSGDDSKKGWGYVPDPRGLDYFSYANESLDADENYVGGGDCDDFAILMSALVESIGGTTRIILARNNSIGGHAYTEVYLGQLNSTNNQVEDIISWLKQKFDTEKIYTHINTDSKEVWLNLDWGQDENGNSHPGGPIFQGDKHLVICIRDSYGKTPLRTPENYNSQEAGPLKSPISSGVSPTTDYLGRSTDKMSEADNPFDISQQLPIVHQASQVPGSDYIPPGTQPVSVAQAVNEPQK